MKRLIFILLLSNFLTPVYFVHAEAQPLSLEECMRYAVSHATSVGERELDLADSRTDYRAAIASLFPSVSGSVGGSTNFGRSIDPATNAYTEVTTFSNSYGLSASMPLFAGLQQINTLRAARVARELGQVDVEVARDEVAIATLKAYMDVVYYTQAVEIAREQLEAAHETLRQATKQYKLGLKSAADVAEMESQEANYDYLLTTEEHNRALAYIRLAEVMNWSEAEQLEVVTDFTIDLPLSATTEEELIDYALENNAQIRSARLTTRIQKLQYARAKGGYLPSLNLSGGVNTSYFIDFDHKSAYDPFWNQFRNNRGSYVSLSLSIPIFSGLNRRSAKYRAQNNLHRAELSARALEQSLRSEVSQSWQQMVGNGKLYVQGQKKVRAAQLAYDGAKKKFENGLISALDLQTAANTLLQAKSDRLRARLEYIIQSRMVDYYNGEPLVR